MHPLLVAGAAVVVASGVGLAWWRGEGRMTLGSMERIGPADVGLRPDAFGERATLLLFGSPPCPDSPAMRRLLAEVADGTPGVTRAEVDLSARGDLAGRYAVLRTPTLFVLDAEHRLRARIPGVATRETVLHALAHTGPPGQHAHR